MIRSLRLTNFKCFERLDVPFGGLTLLSGLNSSGKSTIIQALLLLRQSYLEGLLPDRGVALNGELTQIGTAKDALFEEAEQDELGFELHSDGDRPIRLRFQYREESDVLEVIKPYATDCAWSESLFQDGFQYLRAERIGPRTSFGTSDYEVRHHRQIGSGGEYTVHFLSLFGGETVEADAVRHSLATSNTLLAQVEAWMSEISPGIRLNVRHHPEIDLMSLGLSYLLGHQVVSTSYRPTNVGFGITYALPIVVSVLAARPGSLLIVENPEAHLHPRGQVKIGELLARAVTSGVQVLIETHSDHVLNGIRLAVHDGHTSPTAIKVFYNSWEQGSKSPTLTQLQIQRDGRLSGWPDGFFDEFEKSLDKLMVPHDE